MILLFALVAYKRHCSINDRQMCAALINDIRLLLGGLHFLWIHMHEKQVKIEGNKKERHMHMRRLTVEINTNRRHRLYTHINIHIYNTFYKEKSNRKHRNWGINSYHNWIHDHSKWVQSFFSSTHNEIILNNVHRFYINFRAYRKLLYLSFKLMNSFIK